jgi:hypothetical protein
LGGLGTTSSRPLLPFCAELVAACVPGKRAPLHARDCGTSSRTSAITGKWSEAILATGSTVTENETSAWRGFTQMPSFACTFSMHGLVDHGVHAPEPPVAIAGAERCQGAVPQLAHGAPLEPAALFTR